MHCGKESLLGVRHQKERHLLLRRSQETIEKRGEEEKTIEKEMN